MFCGRVRLALDRSFSSCSPPATKRVRRPAYRVSLFSAPRGRHFQDVIIILCVRWYLRYSLSYRDLEEMIAEPRRTNQEYSWTALPSAVLRRP